MHTSRTAGELLRFAAERLREAGVETPSLDAELLFAHATCRTRTEVLTHPEFVPHRDAARLFAGWIDRRVRREPLPYIIGEREFYGITFEVTLDVLIPRQETEILVDVAVRLLERHRDPTVLDIGVGSGAIAVAIAAHVPEASVYGTDTSPAAIELAHRNACRVGLNQRVCLFEGSLFDPLPDLRFDLIVSNPPYIPSDDIDGLQPEVAKYEPRGALDGGPDGLYYYRLIAAQAGEWLRDQGVIAVEVGAGESTAVEELFRSHGLVEVRSVRDYAGIERAVMAERLFDRADQDAENRSLEPGSSGDR